MLCLWCLFIISSHLLKVEAKLSFEKWNLTQTQHEPTVEEAIMSYLVAKKTRHLHIGINLLEPNHSWPETTQNLFNALRSSPQLTSTIHLAMNNASWNQTERCDNLLYVDSYIAFQKIVTQTNFRGSYIVVLTTANSANVHVNRILATAYDLSIVDIAVVTQGTENKRIVYSYDLFNGNKCGSFQPIEINRFVNGNFMNAELIPNKFENFHNCTITIGTRDLSPYLTLGGRHPNATLADTKGIESEFVKVIAQKLNFQVKFHIFVDEGASVYENGTVTGPFTALQKGDFDVLIGGFMWIPYRNKFFSYSRAYLISQLSCIIKKQDLDCPFWMFDPFTWPVWTLICIVVVSGILGTELRAFLARKTRNSAFSDNRQLWLDVLGTALNTPRSFKGIPRSCTMILIFFCFIIIHTIYQGKLYAAYNHQINFNPRNMHELRNANYSFVAGKTMPAALRDELNLIHRTQLLDMSSIKILDWFLNSTDNVAAIAPREMVLEYMREYLLHNKLKILPEPLLTLYMCTFFRMNSSLDKPFNDVILKLQEGGFFDFWERKQEYLLKSREQQRISLARYPKPLTLDTYYHFFLAFIILNLIACLVFFAELLVYRFKGRWKSVFKILKN